MTATPADKVACVDDERLRLAIRLQMAFGLQLEERLKFRVSETDRGTVLVVQANWC